MSGAVKAGLLFGVIGILAVCGFALFALLIPAGCICGTFAAALVGLGAGFFGVRWSDGNAGVATGVLAGALAGLGTLVGGVLFFVALIAIVRSSPEFNALLLEQINQAMQQQGQTASQQEIDALLNLVGPFTGFCFGTLNLVAALACGALGGLLAARNRSSVAPPASPPAAPPPLAPL